MSEDSPTNPADTPEWESSSLWKASPAATLAPGDQIGEFELLDVIGQGGFGVVYLAEQKRPVKRRVALKVIKPGMDTSTVIARFEAERQALAVMNHPHVAKVFGGGATPDNRPYFVMEYVQGKPITTYCDEHRLSVEDRVELFIQVCEAIQHAHMKGLIHRDLKPANVLIEERSDRPMPKVIDFGVAKALQREEETKQTFTLAGELIGTPEYMSPEQADPQGVDIDTRTDVYSLGVLLYELLTGSPPFDAKTLLASGYSGLQHIITQVDPPIPSSRLSTWGSTARKEQTPRPDSRPSPSDASHRLSDAMTPGRVASERGTDSRSLVRRLRGDLDWIVMKCLEKDRDRRYDTAAALAMDLRRHINNEPVLAGPPSTVYRLRKFVRRNRTGVVAGSAIAAMLVLCTVVSVLFAFNAMESERRAEAQAAEAQRQSEIAAAVNTFLTDDLLSAVAPDRLGRDVSMREVLDAAARVLQRQSATEGRFADKPEVKAGIHRALGETYLGLGQHEQALSHFQRELALLKSARGSDAVETLEAHAAVGRVYRAMAEFDRASEHLYRAYNELLAQLGEDDVKTLAAISAIGGLYRDQGEHDQAKAYFTRALEGYRRVVGDDDPETIRAMNNMGAILYAIDDTEGGLSYYRHAMEGFVRVYGELHPDTLTAFNNMGVVLRNLERTEEAMPYYHKALDGRREVFGDDHIRTLTSINNMAHLMREQGRHEEAESLFREAVDGLQRTMGETHPHTLNAMQSLGQLLRQRGDLEKAEEYYRRVYQAMAETDHRRLGAAVGNLSHLLRDLGRLDEAEPLSRMFVQLREDEFGEIHPMTVLAQQVHGDVLLQLDRPEEAEAVLRSARKRLSQVTLTERDRWFIGDVLRSYGRALIKLDRADEALEVLSEAADILTTVLGDGHELTTDVQEMLTRLNESS